MVVKCANCGSIDVNLSVQSDINSLKALLYCSEDCKLEIEYKNLYVAAWITLIFTFPIFPLWIYLFVKAARVKNLKEQRVQQKLLEKPLCYHCGKELNLQTTGKSICMNCGELIHFCDLCQRHILFQEDILQIEPCGHIFHKKELLKWSEKNNACPKCRVIIEFVDYQPE